MHQWNIFLKHNFRIAFCIFLQSRYWVRLYTAYVLLHCFYSTPAMDFFDKEDLLINKRLSQKWWCWPNQRQGQSWQTGFFEYVCKLNFVCRCFWNSEIWEILLLKPVFIKCMLCAIYGPIWKREDFVFWKKSLNVPTVKLFSKKKMFYGCFRTDSNNPVCYDWHCSTYLAAYYAKHNSGAM